VAISNRTLGAEQSQLHNGANEISTSGGVTISLTVQNVDDSSWGEDCTEKSFTGSFRKRHGKKRPTHSISTLRNEYERRVAR
jgi:hypothetical protein